MSLRIRLSRGGTKKRPHYAIVIADSHSPRDGRFIEKIGYYNPVLPRDHADLIGLRVQDSEGRQIGEIRAIHNFGAGDVIELERLGGGTLLLPFTHDFVPKIDFANGCVTVSEPEDVEAREQRGVE